MRTQPSTSGPDAGLPDAGALEVISLPIEVFSATSAAAIVAVTVHLTDEATGATELALRVHRATWVEQGRFADQGVKMSVAIDGTHFFDVVGDTFASADWGIYPAGWVDTNPQLDAFAQKPGSVTCVPADAQFGGCLVGAYHTVRFSIPLARMSGALVPGANVISFRFNGTNGEEMGFRVLSLDVRAQGRSVVVAGQFRDEDPAGWAPPRDTPADIAAGKRLFQVGALVTSPLDPTPLRARCASCHANDGRDLAYFNFSNHSIIYRSRFHGLSEAEGEQIASYVRSVGRALALPPGKTVKDLGRPWNPPYQPGPGLDDLPQLFWAAGAGLDAGLDEDRQMRDELFSGRFTTFRPGDPKTQPLNGYRGYANPRELRQAIQFPDWMMWLPRIAPEDRLSDPSAWFDSQLYRAYVQLRDVDLPALGSNPTQQQLAQVSWVLSKGAFGEGRSPDFDLIPGDPNAPTATSAQGFLASKAFVSHELWKVLREWELFNTFGLEEAPFIPAGYDAHMPPGQRAWPTHGANVFFVAPHFAGPSASGYREKFDGVHNTYALSFNTTPVGNYFSTAWYTLQLILNGSYQVDDSIDLKPVDWNYHPGHIAGGSYDGRHFPIQPYRWFASVEFFTQAEQVGTLFRTGGDTFVPLLHTFDGLGVFGLETLPPARQVELLDQSILTVMEYLESYDSDRSVWPRQLADPANPTSAVLLGPLRSTASGQFMPQCDKPTMAPHGDICFPPASFVYVPTTGPTSYADQIGRFYFAIVNAKAVGVPRTTLDRMVAWGRAMWPATDWSAL
ncbi:MAG: hypothetical protein ACOZQL_07830 [Myxococcota bacterium]